MLEKERTFEEERLLQKREKHLHAMYRLVRILCSLNISIYGVNMEPEEERQYVEMENGKCSHG